MKNIVKIVGVWLLALLLVACTNKDKHEHNEAAGTAASATTYTCPMHPQIVKALLVLARFAAWTWYR